MKITIRILENDGSNPIVAHVRLAVTGADSVRIASIDEYGSACDLRLGYEDLKPQIEKFAAGANDLIEGINR